MNDLIEHLLNYAFKYGIKYKLIKSDPDDPSLSFKDRKTMIINTNWRKPSELPFIIGHEIGHLVLGDKGVMYYTSFAGQNSEEKPADLYSLNLIFNYSQDMNDGFHEPCEFMQAYGIPERMTGATKELFNRRCYFE